MDITGTVSVGGCIINDYVLTLEQSEGGTMLRIRKGSHEQSALLPGGYIPNRAYIPGGRDLNSLFGGIDALMEAVSNEDYSKAGDLDRYTVRFSGAYRDYSEYCLPAGSVYYSDPACTTEAGAASGDITVLASAFSPAYYTFSLSGNTYYAKKGDLRPYTVRTIDRDVVFEANMNHYLNYGDDPVSTPHICFTASDLCLSSKMRAHPLQWADAVEDEHTGDGSTRVFAPSDAELKYVRYVCVGGQLKREGEDYLSSGGIVTFLQGRAPETGRRVVISRTRHDDPYQGSALCRTLCDEEHGLISTIRDEVFKRRLTNVRIHSSSGWRPGGRLFIPRLGEVFPGAENEPMLPLAAMGSMRRLAKGAGYFTASAASPTAFYAVSSAGTVEEAAAATERGALLCAVIA